MNNTNDEIKAAVKSFILNQFLPGESSEALTDSTELITHGVLDSLSTLQLVTFLEKEYSIALKAHEVNIDHLNTLPDIVKLITIKINEG